jgi:cytochrome b561
MTPRRYHKALVVLHWLLALALIAALASGTFALKTVPNASPEKIDALRGHMIAGVSILVLMLVRLAVRLSTRHPPPATIGNALLDRLAPAMHWALYALVLLMAASGIGIAVLAGLPGIVFGGVGALPASFDAFPPRAVHGIVAKILMIAIGLHVAAALFHHFVRRDGLLRRMSFGPR